MKQCHLIDMHCHWMNEILSHALRTWYVFMTLMMPLYSWRHCQSLALGRTKICSWKWEKHSVVWNLAWKKI